MYDLGLVIVSIVLILMLPSNSIINTAYNSRFQLDSSAVRGGLIHRDSKKYKLGA